MNETRLFVLGFVLACGATLNGLGHQMQIQTLKAEVASLRRDLDAAQASQVRAEDALSQSLLTLIDERDSDGRRRAVEAQLNGLRRDLGIRPASRMWPGEPPPVQYLRTQGFR